MRARSAGAVVAVALTLLTGCNDSSNPQNVLQPGVRMVGSWNATVTEAADTCDDVAWPVIHPSVAIEELGPRYMVWFRDYGGAIDCWGNAFDVVDDTLTWQQSPYEVDLDCNPGCRIRLSTRVDLTFGPGATFSGTETITYEPVTAECDVQQCRYPCADPIDHLLWEFRNGRGCGFACETTFTWQGAIDPPPIQPACGP